MLSLSIPLLSLSVVVAAVDDKRLEEILAQMQEAGDELKTLSADFVQTDYDAILEEREVSYGKLYLEVPGRVRWEHLEPSPKVLLVRDELVRVYNPTAGQVNEFEQKKTGRSSGFDLLVGFGSGNDKIGENYDASLKDENAASVVLTLVPKPDSPASLFTQIDLTVDKTTWTPIRSVFFETNRDYTEIDFENVVLNGKLPGGVFELDLPKDVEIIRN